LIGAGSMKAELLREHIKTAVKLLINLLELIFLLLRQDASQLLKVSIEEGVKNIFTSAGNPKKFIKEIEENNITAVHVVSSLNRQRKLRMQVMMQLLVKELKQEVIMEC
jgi:enoyl-[acyl-carrier protein] reductase II